MLWPISILTLICDTIQNATPPANAPTPPIGAVKVAAALAALACQRAGAALAHTVYHIAVSCPLTPPSARHGGATYRAAENKKCLCVGPA